jgi:PadR family transcriptional regulator, regulatory protein PadR
MGRRSPQLTIQTIKVLGAFSSQPEAGLSGAEIGRATGLLSGTLYPILMRLEQAGWLESKWEEDEPHKLGRPRRRLYRITGLGVKSVRAACGEVTAAIGGLSWVG